MPAGGWAVWPRGRGPGQLWPRAWPPYVVPRPELPRLPPPGPVHLLQELPRGSHDRERVDFTPYLFVQANVSASGDTALKQAFVNTSSFECSKYRRLIDRRQHATSVRCDHAASMRCFEPVPCVLYGSQQRNEAGTVLTCPRSRSS